MCDTLLLSTANTRLLHPHHFINSKVLAFFFLWGSPTCQGSWHWSSPRRGFDSVIQFHWTFLSESFRLFIKESVFYGRFPSHHLYQWYSTDTQTWTEHLERKTFIENPLCGWCIIWNNFPQQSFIKISVWCAALTAERWSGLLHF